MNEEATRRDPMSRAALRQTLWLGLLALGLLVALMTALSWAAALTGSGSATFGAIDADNRAISVALRNEPPQLNSTRTTDTTSSMILGHVMEGLLRYDPQNRLVPGVAERWEIRPDGATFWLRESAVWNDGEPVTAQDFVFAWRTLLDPATASNYAFIAYVIKNAEAINSGSLPTDALGAHALDERTLEVEFENPVGYFDKLMAFTTFYPIREDFYASRAGRYGADVEDLLFNGPFVMTRWVHGSNIRLEKNPRYWNRDAIWLNVIDIPYMTNDGTARLNLFRDGQIADVDHLTAENLEQALNERWPIGRYADGSVWYVLINHRPERLTSNYHLRKALQLADDSTEMLNKVIKLPSYTRAESFFPSWLRGERGLFRQEYPPPPVVPDLAAAREHLELAKAELGMQSLPPIVLLVDDTPTASKKAEYLQDRWNRTLGLDIRIDKQIFKQRLAKTEVGDFDLALFGWSADYDDPLTYGDLFASWNLNNRGRYANPELDAHVRRAQRSTDSAERMAAFAEIQRILIEDAAIVLHYERGVMYVQDARLKGVARRPIGPDPDYSHAYIVDTT